MAKHKEIFLGSRPTTLDTIVRQWFIVSGIPATMFSKENAALELQDHERFMARVKVWERNRRGKERKLERDAPLHWAIYENYKESEHQSLGLQKPHIEAMLAKAFRSKLQTMDFAERNAEAHMASMTPNEQILLLLAVLTEEFDDLLFDNVDMHDRCIQFLHGILPLTPKTAAGVASQPDADWSLWQVNGILHQERVALASMGLFSNMNDVVGVMLPQVAQHMEDFTNRHGSDGLVKM